MDSFHGLIQHSFGLPLTEPRRPYRGRTNSERISERFGLLDGPIGEYRVEPVAQPESREERDKPTLHSPIAAYGQTTVESLQMKYLRCKATADLIPGPFSWAKNDKSKGCEEHPPPRFIFTDRYDDDRRWTISDFQVVGTSRHLDDATTASLALLEVIAHKRSRLFGFALANRFVNVMLPHAFLAPESEAEKLWLMLPLVSFIRGGRDRGRLRNVYSLSLFFVPVESQDQPQSRPMSEPEIEQVVNAGWSYAVGPAADRVDKFRVHGPLLDYLSYLARFDLHAMRPDAKPRVRRKEAGEAYGEYTLRQAVERVAFGVGLSIAQGKGGPLGAAAVKRLGNEVIMALGSARVSSVTVVDPELKAREVRAPVSRFRPFPGSLSSLLDGLSRTIRTAQSGDREAVACRLDRPFVDSDLYAIGVLPTKRCVVVASREDAQCGSRESALMQAGSIAYMALGSASAIGTLRAIDLKVEYLEGADPREVARIDEEIATDLNEVYDLDITRDSYRELYRRLRHQLGITRDYRTLQDEMQTLYRATSTFHEHRSELLLVWLTAAIVLLSLFILLGTVVLIGQGG